MRNLSRRQTLFGLFSGLSALLVPSQLEDADFSPNPKLSNEEYLEESRRLLSLSPYGQLLIDNFDRHSKRPIRISSNLDAKRLGAVATFKPETQEIIMTSQRGIFLLAQDECATLNSLRAEKMNCGLAAKRVVENMFSRGAPLSLANELLHFRQYTSGAFDILEEILRDYATPEVVKANLILEACSDIASIRVAYDLFFRNKDKSIRGYVAQDIKMASSTEGLIRYGRSVRMNAENEISGKAAAEALMGLIAEFRYSRYFYSAVFNSFAGYKGKDSSKPVPQALMDELLYKLVTSLDCGDFLKFIDFKTLNLTVPTPENFSQKFYRERQLSNQPPRP